MSGRSARPRGEATCAHVTPEEDDGTSGTEEEGVRCADSYAEPSLLWSHRCPTSRRSMGRLTLANSTFPSVAVVLPTTGRTK